MPNPNCLTCLGTGVVVDSALYPDFCPVCVEPPRTDDDMISRLFEALSADPNTITIVMTVPSGLGCLTHGEHPHNGSHCFVCPECKGAASWV